MKRTYTVHVDGIYYEYCPENSEAWVVDCSRNGVVTVPTTITIGDAVYNVVRVHDYAFRSCDATTITLPNSITSLGRHAFHGCREITTITIPSGITEIPDGCFCECTSMTSFSLPMGVTRIGKDAFTNTKISTITLGYALEEIDWEAFRGCQALRTVVNGSWLPIVAGSKDFGWIAFYATQVIIPEWYVEFTSIEGQTFPNAMSSLNITLPQALDPTKLDNYALLLDTETGEYMYLVHKNWEGHTEHCYWRADVEEWSGTQPGMFINETDHLTGTLHGGTDFVDKKIRKAYLIVPETQTEIK